MDIVDILIKIVDTRNENFYLQDITIQEISLSKFSNKIVSITAKYYHPYLGKINLLAGSISKS